MDVGEPPQDVIFWLPYHRKSAPLMRIQPIAPIIESGG
jgi:hypothetical protein